MAQVAAVAKLTAAEGKADELRSVITDLVGGTHYDGAKPATGDATIAIFMDCPLTSVSSERK